MNYSNHSPKLNVEKLLTHLFLKQAYNNTSPKCVCTVEMTLSLSLSLCTIVLIKCHAFPRGVSLTISY